jgi:hypothetical protein
MGGCISITTEEDYKHVIQKACEDGLKSNKDNEYYDKLDNECKKTYDRIFIRAKLDNHTLESLTMCFNLDKNKNNNNHNKIYLRRWNI